MSARPRQKTDAEILEAARHCFLEHGAAVSTTVIAERVGLSQPALFKRFGTKERLMLLALAPPPDPEWIRMLSAVPGQGRFKEHLRAIVGAAAKHFTEMMPCMLVLRTSGIDLHKVFSNMEHAPPVMAQQRLVGWLSQAMDRGELRRCNPTAVASAILGGLHHTAFVAHLSGSAPDEALCEQTLDALVDVIWQGIFPKGGSEGAQP